MVAASRLWRGIAGQLASMFNNRPASSLQDQEGVMVVMDVWRRASLGVVGWQQDLSALQILLPLLLQSVHSLLQNQESQSFKKYSTSHYDDLF